ncbi:MAG TPA: dienelactone hydrolase family protein [Solirubrobacteraceae bacterium]|nr:dienelactone hydrolase family protein [Solirubrobacteraceae bacterium]
MTAAGQPVGVPLSDGSTLHTELFIPGGDGPWPGVLVLHESFGLNNDIRRIARRFTQAGYVAMCPDLYSHGTRIVCLSRVIVDMLRGAIAREIADIVAARETLASRPEVDADRTAVAGFCQGGGFALIAGTHPGFRAAAVNYGDVPRERVQLDGVCPVVGSYGARDRVFGRPAAERLEHHLSALGVPHDVKTYDQAGHSFFSQVDGWQGWLARVPTPMRVGYDEAAAEDAWRRMLVFFDEHVRSPGAPSA